MTDAMAETFQIKEETPHGLKRIIIKNPETGEFVSILPRFGSNVNELSLAKRGASHKVIAGNQTAADFKDKSVFKSAKLIPFPNRIKDGAYIFEGNRYQLELNYPEENNACHGFIYDKEFEIEKREAHAIYASVKLSYHYTGFLPGYPFECRIELTYSLEKDRGFACRTTIENLGRTAMPVGDGWHPFFTFHKPVDELFLKLAAEEKIEVDERLIPTGRSSRYGRFDKSHKIGNITFDDCFKIKPGPRSIQVTELYDGEGEIGIQLWQETGKNKYNYIQVYTPPERTSIAIEPVTSNINAFNNLEGLIVLKPNEKFDAGYGVQLL